MSKSKRDLAIATPESTHTPTINPYELLIVGFDPIPEVTAEHPDETGRKLYAQLFDERALMPLDEDKLAMTRTSGIRVPVQYYEYAGRKLVVDGRRRVRYGRAVRDEQMTSHATEPLFEVPYIPFEGSLDDMFAISRSMNVHEQSTPMMTARDMTRLTMETVVDRETGKKRKRTVQEVASIFGVSDQTVRNYMKLFTSSDTVKRALTELRQPTIGLLLTDVPERMQMEILAELRAEDAQGKRPTVDAARKKVAARQGKTIVNPRDKLASVARTIQVMADRFARGELPSAATSTKDELLRTNETLLEYVDTLTRIVMRGDTVFPGPMREQIPGYTLLHLGKRDEEE